MVSEAYLYGFPSSDSDVGLRCSHIEDIVNLFGLNKPREIIEKETKCGIEIEMVSHEIEKFIQLMTRGNGYVLDRL